MAELNTCEYVHQKGEKEGYRCTTVPQNKNRRFCGKHHSYLFWLMEEENEKIEELENHFEYMGLQNPVEFEIEESARHRLGIDREEDLYKQG